MDQKKITSKEFFELATSGNQSRLNRISEVLISRMGLYLQSVMGADIEIAKDCAQQAFEKVYGKITTHSIDNIDDLFGYLIRSARNEYLMFLRRDKFEVPSEHSYFTRIEGTSSDDVINSLYSEEKEKLLEYCIEKLKEGKRKFFKFVLEHINERDKDSARKLKMSHGNFRTKKSRVIDALRECVQNATID
ncbi:MAG: sigma-70 family RNA polymerase sigma factor [Balneolaceae bacterium]|nr:sigma-70 family RNA polymerase sigma factor [Balneolaceae bacterium]